MLVVPFCTSAYDSLRSCQGCEWKAESYNSLPGCCSEELAARGEEIILALQQYAAELSFGHEVQFVTPVIPVPCPEQGNGADCGIDCGVFAVGFAAAIMLDFGISNIIQNKVPQYRLQWPQQLRRAGKSGIHEVFTHKLLGA